jgi:hypothetical protein
MVRPPSSLEKTVALGRDGGSVPAISIETSGTEI